MSEVVFIAKQKNFYGLDEALSGWDEAPASSHFVG